MSLAKAVAQGGATPVLPDGPPYRCAGLLDWAGRTFSMPAGDPRLNALHEGGSASSAPHDNLVGAVRYWDEHPDWMEFLDPGSPSHDDKMVERALYLDFWESHLPAGSRVLDLGGGVGRFMQWLLQRDCEVELVDPDLRSLWRAVQTGAQTGRGFLDVHWSTGECLPQLAPVVVALMVEVLCYVEDPVCVLERVFETLRPGGTLLCSVEARWGWAMAADVHPETIEAFLDDGVVHVPGDRWVRTFTEDTREQPSRGLRDGRTPAFSFCFLRPLRGVCGSDGCCACVGPEASPGATVAGRLNRVDGCGSSTGLVGSGPAGIMAGWPNGAKVIGLRDLHARSHRPASLLLLAPRVGDNFCCSRPCLRLLVRFAKSPASRCMSSTACRSTSDGGRSQMKSSGSTPM